MKFRLIKKRKKKRSVARPQNPLQNASNHPTKGSKNIISKKLPSVNKNFKILITEEKIMIKKILFCDVCSEEILKHWTICQRENDEIICSNCLSVLMQAVLQECTIEEIREIIKRF